MKLLLVHNFYREPGGEDEVFRAEACLLERHGHDVQRLSFHNDQVERLSKLRLAAKAFWNGDAHQQISELVREHRFDVVHFHNTFPLLSPAAYYAARSNGAAVVQTLHNYRL